MRVEARAPLITAVPVSGAALRALAAAHPARYPGVLRQRRAAARWRCTACWPATPRAALCRDADGRLGATGIGNRAGRISRQPRSAGIAARRTADARQPDEGAAVSRRLVRLPRLRNGGGNRAAPAAADSATRRTPHSRCASRTSPCTISTTGQRLRGVARRRCSRACEACRATSQEVDDSAGGIDARPPALAASRRRAARTVPGAGA